MRLKVGHGHNPLWKTEVTTFHSEGRYCGGRSLVNFVRKSLESRSAWQKFLAFCYSSCSLKMPNIALFGYRFKKDTYWNISGWIFETSFWSRPCQLSRWLLILRLMVLPVGVLASWIQLFVTYSARERHSDLSMHGIKYFYPLVININNRHIQNIYNTIYQYKHPYYLNEKMKLNLACFNKFRNRILVC